MELDLAGLDDLRDADGGWSVLRTLFAEVKREARVPDRVTISLRQPEISAAQLLDLRHVAAFQLRKLQALIAVLDGRLPTSALVLVQLAGELHGFLRTLEDPRQDFDDHHDGALIFESRRLMEALIMFGSRKMRGDMP